MPDSRSSRATSRETRAARAASQRRMVIIASAAIVVLVAAIGVVGVLTVNKLNAGSGGTPAPTASVKPVAFAQDTPATADGAKDCIEVPVLTSFENAEMVQNLAKAYSAQPRSIDGHCVTLTVAKDKSGTSAQRAAAKFPGMSDADKPVVWIPDASSWLSVARDEYRGGAVVPASGTSVARTDVVLAMPQDLAKASGWDTKTPTWDEVFAASSNANMWKDLGHPEWGTFKLGKTSPLVASSGQAAMLASYGSAADGITALTAEQIADPHVTSQVKRNELATSHYMATPEHFLWHAREAELKGSVATFLSAVIVDEKSVWDYDRGITSRDGITRTQSSPPKEALVPIYPKDGFYTSDNAAAVLTGAWVSDQQKDAAADFVRYAKTQQGQDVVRTSGYRDLNGALDGSVQKTAHLQAMPAGGHAIPGGSVIAAVDKAFPNVRKRADVLFLVDVSGSMNDKLPTGGTKLDAAKAAIAEALDHFTAGDHVGLAAFSSEGGAQITPGVVAPVADISKSRDAFVKALDALKIVRFTPLYAAVDQFSKQQASHFDPHRINAMVVLSDGANYMKQPTISQEDMLRNLDGLHESGTPVLVFTLAYGSGADVPTLKAISAATGAHYYDATNPAMVKTVLGDLVTSF